MDDVSCGINSELSSSTPFTNKIAPLLFLFMLVMDSAIPERDRTAQEVSDAAFARQLQEELNHPDEPIPRSLPAAVEGPDNRSPESAQSAVSTAHNELSISCPACTFLNQLSGPFESKQQRCCQQCRTPIPIPKEYLRNPRKRDDVSQFTSCKFCHCLNRMPKKKADAFLCGACYQELGSSMKEDNCTLNSGVVNANDLRTVQVRCGRCSAVNAVQVDSKAAVVQFECGGCSTVNEVKLS